jgi:hypothetical protein
MVARIWRTAIEPARAEEYGEFARSRLPMFRARLGSRGVLFASRNAERMVITLLGGSFGRGGAR